MLSRLFKIYLTASYIHNLLPILWLLFSNEWIATTIQPFSGDPFYIAKWRAVPGIQFFPLRHLHLCKLDRFIWMRSQLFTTGHFTRSTLILTHSTSFLDQCGAATLNVCTLRITGGCKNRCLVRFHSCRQCPNIVLLKAWNTTTAHKQ